MKSRDAINEMPFWVIVVMMQQSRRKRCGIISKKRMKKKNSGLNQRTAPLFRLQKRERERERISHRESRVRLHSQQVKERQAVSSRLGHPSVGRKRVLLSRMSFFFISLCCGKRKEKKGGGKTSRPWRNHENFRQVNKNKRRELVQMVFFFLMEIGSRQSFSLYQDDYVINPHSWFEKEKRSTRHTTRHFKKIVYFKSL